MFNKKGFSSNLAIVIAALAALVVVVGLGYWFLINQSSVISDLPAGAFGEPVDMGTKLTTAGQDYFAVFSTDGQVYFAQIGSEVTEQFVLLKNVYYLQQTQGQDGQTGSQLVRRGGEMYGPDGDIMINRDHVITLERLRGDSEVLKAINGEAQVQ